jgi:hypothetical protein
MNKAALGSWYYTRIKKASIRVMRGKGGFLTAQCTALKSEVPWLVWAQMTKKVPHTQPRPSQPPSKPVLATGKNGLLNRLPAKVSFSIFD